MSYTIEQLDEAVTRAVKREREKWQSTQVFWTDELGNTHPVPVLHRVEWGGSIMVQIERPAPQRSGEQKP
jgi:hypothetical protein